MPNTIQDMQLEISFDKATATLADELHTGKLTNFRDIPESVLNQMDELLVQAWAAKENFDRNTALNKVYEAMRILMDAKAKNKAQQEQEFLNRGCAEVQENIEGARHDLIEADESLEVIESGDKRTSIDEIMRKIRETGDEISRYPDDCRSSYESYYSFFEPKSYELSRLRSNLYTELQTPAIKAPARTSGLLDSTSLLIVSGSALIIAALAFTAVMVRRSWKRNTKFSHANDAQSADEIQGLKIEITGPR